MGKLRVYESVYDRSLYFRLFRKSYKNIHLAYAIIDIVYKIVLDPFCGLFFYVYMMSSYKFSYAEFKDFIIIFEGPVIRELHSILAVAYLLAQKRKKSNLLLLSNFITK